MNKSPHGGWIIPSFLAFSLLCLIAFIPHMVRNGIAAATLLLAVFVLAMIGASVAVWLTGR
jgi:hypothetical protein